MVFKIKDVISLNRSNTTLMFIWDFRVTDEFKRENVKRECVLDYLRPKEIR